MTSATGAGHTGTQSDAFAAAHARLLADRDIQFALPPVEQQHIPHWLEVLGRILRDAAPVIRIAMWIGMGVAVLMLLWLIARRFLDWRWPWRKAAEEPAEQPEWRPAAAPARALLAEADALAAAGRHAEAARLLLHRSVEDIASRRPGLVRPATTSRDLAATPEIPAAARPAFAAIAGVVEMGLFADRGTTADAWASARAAYADFALAGNWR